MISWLIKVDYVHFSVRLTILWGLGTFIRYCILLPFRWVILPISLSVGMQNWASKKNLLKVKIYKPLILKFLFVFISFIFNIITDVYRWFFAIVSILFILGCFCAFPVSRFWLRQHFSLDTFPKEGTLDSILLNLKYFFKSRHDFKFMVILMMH